MADQVDTSWRSPVYRQKVMTQIEEAVRQSGNPTSKSSMEMENHVFQKAKSRDEYLALVARLILHVKEINKKKERNNQQHPYTLGMQGPQDPMSALHNLSNQQMAPQQGGMPLQQGQMNDPNMGMTHQQQRPQFNQYQQQTPGNMQGPRGMMPQPGMQMGRNDGFMGQPQPPQQQNINVAQTSQQMQLSVNTGMNQGMQNQGMQNQGMQNQGMQNQGIPNSQMQQQMGQTPLSNPMMVQSPAQQSTVSLHSPANVGPIPSPSTVAPSPATSWAAAPSPINLNTPGHSTVSPAQPRTAEEQAYLDKLKQLQKYVDPLKRMIVKIEKDDERLREVMKMKNLLEILTDSSKRLALNTLQKCEQVLEKLELQIKSSTTGSTTTPVTTVTTTTCTIKSQQPLCQPLLDAVANNINSPMLNHTLERTFGPAVQALHGPSTRIPSPPSKRQKTDNSHSENEIPNVLQGEIARLEPRFKVILDPIQHNGSKAVHLVCRLEDKNLPSVPPINVTVPENYPMASPICDTDFHDYETTVFLQSISKKLAGQLLQLPSQFSITALLDTWEMSVRQACSPVSSTTLK